MAPQLSTRFYIGIILIIASLILGKVTTIITITYWADPVIRYTSIIVYILSWPILILGAYWSGQEYVDRMRRYSSPTFYHDAVKKHAQIAYAKSDKLRNRVKNTKTNIQGKVKATQNKIKSKMNETHNKVKGKIQSIRTQK